MESLATGAGLGTSAHAGTLRVAAVLITNVSHVYSAQPVVDGASFGFLQATITCPTDAHTLDLVFSDSGELTGGFYDNNKGLDYHIPVEGGSDVDMQQKSMHVVHVTVEMAPIAKVGGLGDVVTALGRAVQEQGHQVHVILPKYDCINYGEVENLVWATDFNWAGTSIKVWKGFVEGLETVFLEPLNGIFWVGCIYGRNDDAGRFTFFCNAALEYLRNVSGWRYGGFESTDALLCTATNTQARHSALPRLADSACGLWSAWRCACRTDHSQYELWRRPDWSCHGRVLSGHHCVTHVCSGDCRAPRHCAKP